jgi:predicted MFS family arabinose efflux permease
MEMKRNIVIMNFAAALIWMSMYVYVPTLPAYAASIGANVVMIGIIGGSYGVMQIILRWPLGAVSDKIGRDRLMMITGFAILVASCLLFVLQNDNVYMVVFARGVAGAAAAWWVVISASYAKYNSEDRQVKAQGVINASASIGKFAAAALCSVVAQFFGYHATFVASLVVAVIGMALMFGLKEVKPKKEVAVPSIKEQLLLVKNKHLLAFSALGILIQFLCFSTANTFTPVAAEALGADSVQLGLIILVFFIVTAISAFFVGTKPYKALGARNALAISFAIGALSCLPALYHINMAWLYFGQVLSGVCYGITQGITAGLVIRCVPPAQRGGATGFFQSAYAAGILAGPVIVGYVIDRSGFDAAYWMTLALMGAAALLSYVIVPRQYDKMT